MIKLFWTLRLIITCGIAVHPMTVNPVISQDTTLCADSYQYYTEAQSLYFNNVVESIDVINADERYTSGAIGFSPADEMLLLTNHLRYDGRRDQVRLWNWRTAFSVPIFARRFTEFALSGTSAYWSPNGDKVALLNNEDGRLNIHALDQNETYEVADTSAGYARVIWSPDGNQFAIPDNDRIVLWDAEIGQVVREVAIPDPIDQLVWSETNGLRWLVREQVDDNITRFSLWEENAQEPIFVVEGLGYYGFLSPNGTWLATRSLHEINVWNTDVHELVRTIPTNEVRNVGWSSNECYLFYTEITRESDPHIGVTIPNYWLQIWSINSEERVSVIRSANEFANVSISQSGDYIAFSINNDVIRIYERITEE